MKLYSYYRSSASWRVRIVLAHKAIAYEYVPVDLRVGQRAQDTPEYSAINPLRQVPVLEWAEQGHVMRLTQSVAIAEYLETLHPKPALLPSDALAQARVREAVEIVGSGIQPLQNSRPLAQISKLAGDAVAGDWARDAIARGLHALELHAQAFGAGFSVGDTLTLADVFLVPQLGNARRYGVDLAPYPMLRAIDARASELPAFIAAHPDHQPDAPAPQGDAV